LRVLALRAAEFRRCRRHPDPVGTPAEPPRARVCLGSRGRRAREPVRGRPQARLPREPVRRVQMKPLLLAVLVGCQGPVLRGAAPTPLFGGGDGKSPSVDHVIRGPITQDTELDASKPWILDGLVDVGDDDHEVDFVVDPGTIVYGNPTSRGTL